jgi:hypothetical protein
MYLVGSWKERPRLGVLAEVVLENAERKKEESARRT